MATVILGTRGTSGFPEFAGSTWVRLHYMLGLQKLGVDAFWVDRLGVVNPLKHHHSLDYLMRRFERTMNDFGLRDRYCVIYNGGEQYFGMPEARLRALVEEADLLINISGYLPPTCPLAGVRRRAYVDVDPGFTQIWALGCDMGLARHHVFFSVGQNLGSPSFRIPTGDIEWCPIAPPVFLDEWPSRPDPRCTRLSTVADWRGSQEAMFDQEYYGGKRKEFLRLLRLPRDSGQPIELALCIGSEDAEDAALLVGNDWVLHDPYLYAGDPHSYREFIQHSRAEFSVAKSGYVKSNSGWVSDRTAAYLASGKPALVQSTGFERRLPTGRGLLTFRTADEAMAGIDEINSNYDDHCRAARQIAEKYFDSGIVLRELLSRAGTAPPRRTVAASNVGSAT
jgi:hypothetical protein